MKTFLTRRLRLFKWSVPVWAIALILVAGVALAAFAVVLSGVVQGTSASAVDVSWSSEPVCVLSSGVGSIDCSSSTTTNTVISIAGFDDTTVYDVQVNINNNSGGTICPAFTPPSPPVVISNPPPSNVTGNDTWYFQLSFDSSLGPDEVVDASYSVSWNLCP